MIPLATNIKRFFSLKEIVIAALAVAISVSAGAGVFAYLKKDVVILDNGRTITLKTMRNTVKEALEQKEIKVTKDDYISVAPETQLQRMKTNEIVIKRAVPVKVFADGTEYDLMTWQATVGEALDKGSIELNKLDRLVGVNSSDKITSNMDIKIVRVNEKIVTEKEAIPFQVMKKKNNQLNEGTEKVVREGKEGAREKQYRVVTEDGKETLRELLSDAEVLSPINMLVEFGTVLNKMTARGDTIRYSKVLDMKATAYTASFKDTGKRPGDPGFGITRTGIRAKKGVIAVDPRVIPLGTRVYVEVAGNTPDYGIAVAADTGGAIKNNKIDLYFDDQDFVDRWGVKKVKVYILLD